MTNTKDTGDQTEAMSIARLRGVGKTVLEPFGDNSKYDIVYENCGNFIKVQCRTARTIKDGDCLEFKCFTSGHNNTDGTYHNTYDKSEVDEYFVYSPDEDTLYVIKFDEAPKKAMTLRLESPEIDNPNINFAEEYEFFERFK